MKIKQYVHLHILDMYICMNSSKVLSVLYYLSKENTATKMQNVKY